MARTKKGWQVLRLEFTEEQMHQVKLAADFEGYDDPAQWIRDVLYKRMNVR